MRTPKKFFVSLILMMFLVFSVQNIAAYASVDTKDVSLKIVYKYDETNISDAGLNLYYIADMDNNCNFTVADKFKDYPVDLNTNDYAMLAQTLYGYVKLDNIKPTETSMTDSRGEAVFLSSANNLKQGMYLVTVDDIVVDGYEYTSEPYLVSLPLFNSDINGFEYDVISYPKCDRKITGITKLTSVSVVKKWNDKGNENNRPESITVKLLENGKLYDTQKLSESNNWYYSWDKLSVKSEWIVVEEPVKDYTVSLERVGDDFIITNTTDGSDSDTDSAPSTDTSSTSTPSLPQTGTLWWAVPVLAAIGLSMFLIGYLIRRGSKDE